MKSIKRCCMMGSIQGPFLVWCSCKPFLIYYYLIRLQGPTRKARPRWSGPFWLGLGGEDVIMVKGFWARLLFVYLLKAALHFFLGSLSVGFEALLPGYYDNLGIGQIYG